MACANAVAPLQLPIANFSVTPDGFGFTRGVQLGIGTPQQIVSLVPGMSDVNTYVWNSAVCAPSNNSCLAGRGGVFNPQLSSSFAETRASEWNGSRFNGNEAQFIYFNDVLHYGSTGESFGYPLELGGGEYTPDYPGAVPLGRGSAFLEAVIKDNQAPSDVYGLWTGSESLNAPSTGLLVVGGYDRSRVGGEWTNVTFPEGCPGACVTVTNMTYDYEGGSLALMSDHSEDFSVRLDSTFPYMSLPQPVFDRFSSATNATWNDTWEQLSYERTHEPSGNLSVTLSNGFQTSIVASEYSRTPRTYNAKGTFTFVNESQSVSVVINISSSSRTQYWGLPYLGSVYLLVDYKEQEFQIAAARRAPYTNDDGPDIVPICAAVSNSTADANATAPATTPIPNHHKSHTGAIAGGVVGGVVGLALILGLGFLLWRRRRKSKSPSELAGTPLEKKRTTEMSNTEISELHGKTPAELGAGTDGFKELSGSSEPTEFASDSSRR